jgi:hypothetical protein
MTSVQQIDNDFSPIFMNRVHRPSSSYSSISTSHFTNHVTPFNPNLINNQLSEHKRKSGNEGTPQATSNFGKYQKKPIVTSSNPLVPQYRLHKRQFGNHRVKPQPSKTAVLSHQKSISSIGTDIKPKFEKKKMNEKFHKITFCSTRGNPSLKNGYHHHNEKESTPDNKRESKCVIF